MSESHKERNMALLYLGAFAPDRGKFGSAATSAAGDLFQLNFLTALTKSHLPNPTVFSYFPVPSFPREKLFFLRSSSATLDNGLEVRSLSHINLGAIKIATLGISAAWRTLIWAWQNRHAGRRVVICYNLTAPPAWPIKIVCRWMKLDLVPFIGDIYVPGEVVKDTFFRRLEFAGQKRLIPLVDGLLVANQSIVEDFAPNRHSLLVEGGVMESLVERFEKVERKDDKSFHIVFAGQLSVLNGVTLLLDAIKILDMHELRVTILGAGQFSDAVQAAADQDSRIRFKGLCSHEEVLHAYEQADLLVNLRRTEYQTHRYVFPSKVVECLATGRPLLTTCTGHVEKEFSDFVFKLREESASALADEIRKIAALPREDRDALGRKAQTYIREHKTWEGHTLRLETYLNEHVFVRQEAA